MQDHYSALGSAWVTSSTRSDPKVAVLERGGLLILAMLHEPKLNMLRVTHKPPMQRHCKFTLSSLEEKPQTHVSLNNQPGYANYDEAIVQPWATLRDKYI